MQRRRFLATASTAALPLLTGCHASQRGDGTALQNGSFEAGLAHWTRGRDVPTDPNTGDPVATRVDVSEYRASHGVRSLELFIDGRQDDGTIWVQQPADLGGVDTLAVDAFSPQQSFNTITTLAAYAGPNPGKPLTERDFDTGHAIEDHQGWKTYEYPVTHDATGLVAVGVSVVWETEVTRLLDDVRLR